MVLTNFFFILATLLFISMALIHSPHQTEKQIGGMTR